MQENLIEYRVKGQASIDLWTQSMTTEQILERRSTLRRILKGTDWQNLANAELDSIRLLPSGSGYTLEDPNGIFYFVPGRGVSREETEFRRIRAAMPREFEGKTGSSFDWGTYHTDISAPMQYVNEFVTKFEHFRKNGMGLYIYSATKGSGKTFLSCCLINELLKRYSVTAKFINALDLLELTKATYKGIAEEELEALYTASVLVIDDIGVQMSKEWSDTVFYRLVNARYNNRLVTIYTSKASCPFRGTHPEVQRTAECVSDADRQASNGYGVLLLPGLFGRGSAGHSEGGADAKNWKP